MSALKQLMRVHFIAIGGSAMHNLALALNAKGYDVSGSDDEIFEPSRGRLKQAGLLPPESGWFPDKIIPELDAVILGMHARMDNPELIRAREMGITIYSYPEFLYEQSKQKKRVVIAGSHGKTSITAMVLHVLKANGIGCDYMVGAQLEGFDVMVKISSENEIMVFEGDEYLTSPIDPRPKFHLYKPHIALITGIAWDHINVFPSFENYIEQFRTFIELIGKDGTLVWYQGDPELRKIAETNNSLHCIAYGLPDHRQEEGRVFLRGGGKEYPIKVFGDHNLQNIAGAQEVCRLLGVSDPEFYEAISTFGGASRRLQLIADNAHTAIYLDFAHAPSKLKATVLAMKEHYAKRQLCACMELHTFSSLNRDFLSQYRGAMDAADDAIVFYSPHALSLKRLPDISPEDIRTAFGRDDLKVFSDREEMLSYLLSLNWIDRNLLLMSSGSFDGLDVPGLSKKILK